MKQKNSFEEAYSLILEEIISGSLKPGEVVTEVYLAEKYGISRTPVREALSRFQCEGLINTSNRTKRIYSLSIQDIEEIFELKKLIEGDITLKAAENLTVAQAKELKQIVTEMTELSEFGPENEAQEEELLQKWLDLDKKFHNILFSACGNQRAQQFIQRLNLQWHRLKIGLVAIEGRIGHAILEHREIANAVIEKNPDKAREIMIEHLENLKKVILKLMYAFNYSFS